MIELGFHPQSCNDEEEEDADKDHVEKGDTDSTDTPPVDNTKASASGQPLWIEPGPAIDTTCAPTTAALRKALVKEVKQSKDKLFLIKRLRPSHRLASWHLVQVDEEETSWRLAAAEGVYHVLFYVRCFADSKKKKVKDCAYWPEIHEFKRDGETMGPIVPTKPSKVDHLLNTKSHRFMWYQDSINLFDARIVGPFDFEDGFRVPSAAWNALLRDAEGSLIYVGAVNRTIPLDKPDHEDTDFKGGAHSHLAFRWNIYQGTE